MSILGSHAAHAQQIQTVWVIDMENRNWTQPSTDSSAPAQIFGNSAAPYINSLVTPGHPNAALVSYASQYHNVLATPSGSNPSIHPSEPNYLWQEAGSNFGVTSDSEPYGSGGTVAAISSYLASHPTVSGQNLCALLQNANISWKSYQEGIDLQTTGGGNVNTGGTPTSTVLPSNQWTVPLSSFSGTSSSYTNPYNGSHQYNFACKHDGTLFFTATNGSTTTANTSTSNPEVSHYAPLEQLQTDLNNGTCAHYNLITPDQYNDMHTALSGGFTYVANNNTHYTGDLAQLAQGDNFLSIIVPRIMASSQFQNNGAIIIWTDETEGSNQNDFQHTLMEIVISPRAKGNAFNVTDDLTHSSDLATLQEIFNVSGSLTRFLNDANNPSNVSGTLDMANFFQPGALTGGDTTPPTDTPTLPLPALALFGAALLIAAMRVIPPARIS